MGRAPYSVCKAMLWSFSTCNPWTRYIITALEFIQNPSSNVSWIRNYRERLSYQFFNKFSSRFWCTLRFGNHCISDSCLITILCILVCWSLWTFVRIMFLNIKMYMLLNKCFIELSYLNTKNEYNNACASL
jgi:hypothetical protein